MAQNEQGAVKLTTDFKMQYSVRWEIEIWATDAKDAARQALIIQRDPESTAKVFLVNLSSGQRVEIDLAQDDAGAGEEKAPPPNDLG